jgi:nucleoside-diphosphate-sugar epimerase
MTVLVIGATGFIGQPLVRALLARGEEVAAASRGGAGPCGVVCDRRDVAAVVALAAARRVRTVIDLLAYTEADTLPLFDALSGGVERYVLASSLDVYRNYEGLHRKAAPDPILEPMDEGAPPRASRHPYRAEPRRPADSPDAWLDDYDKIPLEEGLHRADLIHTILRLPMIYGPGDRQQRFRWIISPTLGGRQRLAIDPAWAAWRTTYGFVDDVADAIAQSACHAGAPDGTFNLGEAEPPHHATWVARFGRAIGWTGAIVLRPAPPDSPIANLNLAYPLIADTRAFREAYAWREPTALEERLERTVAEQRARDGQSA